MIRDAVVFRTGCTGKVGRYSGLLLTVIVLAGALELPLLASNVSPPSASMATIKTD